MTRLRPFPALLGFVTFAAAANPSDMPSVRFEHKDWELACDNTRTCRAAGYHAEDVDGPNASLLLTRAAGANQRVRAELQLADDQEHPAPPALEMTVAGHSLGRVAIDGKTNIGVLTAAQVDALLPALMADKSVAWKSGKASWTISSAGANAVLLKMDDFQGRIGTPGALVRKGNKAESSVLPALPVPHVRAGAVVGKNAIAHPFNATETQRLLAELRKTVKADDCELLDNKEQDNATFEAWQLTPDTRLVAHRCWMGAYNEGRGFWVVANRAPYSPVLVTTGASDYDGGVISSAQKGRGIGDCMALDSWTWDGRSFSQTASSTTGMCRQIAAGGPWDLPTITTQVDKHR